MFACVARVLMEIEQEQEFVARALSLWEPTHLESLCEQKAREEVEELVCLLMKINVGKLIASNASENVVRSLDLLQSLVKANRDVSALLRKTAGPSKTTESEIVQIGQKYYDIRRASRKNLECALKRIDFTGDPAFLLEIIVPKESIEYYVEYLLHNEIPQDILAFLQRCNTEWTRDIYRALLKFLDRPNYTKFFCQYCEGDHATVLRFVLFTKENLPFQYQQCELRRAVLVQLADYSYKRYECIAIIDELPDFVADDFQWIEHHCFDQSDIMDCAKKSTLKDFIRCSREGKTKSEKPTNVILNKIAHMNLDELCQTIKSEEGKKMDHIYAFTQRFQVFFKQQYNLDVHPALMNMNKLIKSFAHMIGCNVKLMDDRDVLFYNEMLALFLTDIPSSCSSDLEALCPCCEKSFAFCLVDFDGVEGLVPLTQESQEKLDECRALTKLPSLEQLWGLGGVSVREEEEEVVEEMIDDGIELGHFSDDEDIY